VWAYTTRLREGSGIDASAHANASQRIFEAIHVPLIVPTNIVTSKATGRKP